LFTETDTVYFNSHGKVNTEKTLQVAVEYAAENDIQAIVIAATEGDSAFLLKELAEKSGYEGKLIAVTYHEGFHSPGEKMMPDKNRDKLVEEGYEIHSGTHALSGIVRSFRLKWQGIDVPEIVSETLRLFGRGTKTAVEISIMAADGGLIPDINKDIIAIAGSSRGADTALVMRAANQNSFIQDMKIRKILCKPSEF